jgi:two-component system nitrogen regulation response regulator NtrX
LRERRDEIDSLISHFTSELAMKLNRNRSPVFREDALTMLRRHDWPGNIRQLRTIVQSAILFADDNNTVTPDSLASAGLPVPGAPLLSSPPPPPGSPSSSPSCEAAEELSRERVLEALAATAWNQTRVAKLLGIPRNKLIRLMERYNIPRPRAQCDSDHRKDGLS